MNKSYHNSSITENYFVLHSLIIIHYTHFLPKQAQPASMTHMFAHNHSKTLPSHTRVLDFLQTNKTNESELTRAKRGARVCILIMLTHKWETTATTTVANFHTQLN